MRTLNLIRRLVKGTALTAEDHDQNLTLIESDLVDTLYADMLAPIQNAGVPNNSASTLQPFGPASSPQRVERAFGIGDYVFMQPFHVNHDVKPNGKAYVHIHWSTNGTNPGPVAWQITLSRALGHNQANFSVPIQFTLEQNAAGSAWRHMIVEATENQMFTLAEPDELIQLTLQRVAPSAGSNSDTVFALMVDLHYEMDRRGTPSKSPDFYT